MENRKTMKIDEVATMIGTTIQYTRELCRNHSLKAKKVGKEWIINKKDVENYLGITTSEDDYKKDLYIKELEEELKHYRFVLSTVKMNISNLTGILE